MFYDRVGINRLVHAVNEGRPYADTTGIQNEISSLQKPFPGPAAGVLAEVVQFPDPHGFRVQLAVL